MSRLENCVFLQNDRFCFSSSVRRLCRTLVRRRAAERTILPKTPSALFLRSIVLRQRPSLGASRKHRACGLLVGAKNKKVFFIDVKVGKLRFPSMDRFCFSSSVRRLCRTLVRRRAAERTILPKTPSALFLRSIVLRQRPSLGASRKHRACGLLVGAKNKKVFFIDVKVGKLRFPSMDRFCFFNSVFSPL